MVLGGKKKFSVLYLQLGDKFKILSNKNRNKKWKEEIRNSEYRNLLREFQPAYKNKDNHPGGKDNKAHSQWCWRPDGDVWGTLGEISR